MKTSNREELIRRLSVEFDKIDKKNSKFKAVFVSEIFSVVKHYSIYTELDYFLKEHIVRYAIAILNSTESVIYKDFNYNDFRKKQELESMSNANNRIEFNFEKITFVETVNSRAKELITENFPKVFDLTGFGFRLLELNTKFYTNTFVLRLISELNK